MYSKRSAAQKAKTFVQFWQAQAEAQRQQAEQAQQAQQQFPAAVAIGLLIATALLLYLMSAAR
jgi:3-polyprenyl-4-hydroxybenzoate decarboxylase